METTSVSRAPIQVQFPQGCDSLIDRCVLIMNTKDSVEKANLTLLLGEQWRANIAARSNSDQTMDIGRATPPDKPLRHEDLEFVRPGFGVKVGKAGSLSSRIAILHALANVEQWAIDTALDNMARFGHYTQATAGTFVKDQIENEESQEFRMPNKFFDDFVQMACDEAKHFKWLVERLESQGAHFGDLPVHASIWDSCTDTAKSALARMAVVHMTIESRGLDVNPATIARFDRSGDQDSAVMLQKIHDDEVTHVQIGHRWFCYLLKKHEGVGSTGNEAHSAAFGASASQDIDKDGDGELYEFRQVIPEGQEETVDPIEAQRRKRFQEIVVQYFKGALKPPFNTVDREKGGMSRGWYEPLVVVRERTGFKPAGRRAAEKKLGAEVAAEVAAGSAPSTLAFTTATAALDAEAAATSADRKFENHFIVFDTKMCFGFESMHDEDDVESIGCRGNEPWVQNETLSPLPPYHIPPHTNHPPAQAEDFGFLSTCRQDLLYERQVGVNAELYYHAYEWARYLDGNRRLPNSNVGPSDRVPHYRRQWWYRHLFDEGLYGAFERVGLSFFIGFVPLIGSIICLLLSYVFVYRRISKYQLPPTQLWSLKVAMWKLLLCDFLIGLIFPIAPFLRSCFHANLRIIHFAFDSKTHYERHIEQLHSYNIRRIREAQRDKSQALTALKMFQQYHSDCIHTLRGADLMFAAENAIVSQELLKIECELIQARMLQIRQENERSKSYNAFKPLIKRNTLNSEYRKTYSAIVPTVVPANTMTSHSAGVGPSGLRAPQETQPPAAITTIANHGPAVLQAPKQAPPPIEAAQVAVAQEPLVVQATSIFEQALVAPRQSSHPVASHQPRILDVRRRAYSDTFQQTQAPTQQHQVPASKQTSIARPDVMARRRSAAIYQAMPPRRQALVLCDMTTFPSINAPPPKIRLQPSAAQMCPTHLRQATGQYRPVAQARLPLVLPVENPVTHKQAMAAQQALSVRRESPERQQHVPAPTHVAVIVDAPVMAATRSDTCAVVPLRQESMTPRSNVAALARTNTATPTIVPTVAPNAAATPAVEEVVQVSPSTIQAYMALMQQRLALIDQFNSEESAPGSNSLAEQRPAVNLDAPRVAERAEPTGTSEESKQEQQSHEAAPAVASEGEETVVDSEEQAVWEVLSDSEDAYGDDEADHGGDGSDNTEYSDESASSGDSESGSSEGDGDDGDNEGDDNEGDDNEGGDNEGGDNEGGDNEGGNHEEGDDEDEGDETDDDVTEGNGESTDATTTANNDESCSRKEHGGDDEGENKDSNGNPSGQKQKANGGTEAPVKEEDEGDLVESDKEDHWQMLGRNFAIAVRLNKINNRPMSRLGILLALESSEFSESNLSYQRNLRNIEKSECSRPGSLASSLSSTKTALSHSSTEAEPIPEQAGETAFLENGAQEGRGDESDASDSSELSSLEKAIERVLSNHWQKEVTQCQRKYAMASKNTKQSKQQQQHAPGKVTSSPPSEHANKKNTAAGATSQSTSKASRNANQQQNSGQQSSSSAENNKHHHSSTRKTSGSHPQKQLAKAMERNVRQEANEGVKVLTPERRSTTQPQEVHADPTTYPSSSSSSRSLNSVDHDHDHEHDPPATTTPAKRRPGRPRKETNREPVRDLMKSGSGNGEHPPSESDSDNYSLVSPSPSKRHRSSEVQSPQRSTRKAATEARRRVSSNFKMHPAFEFNNDANDDDENDDNTDDDNVSHEYVLPSQRIESTTTTTTPPSRHSEERQSRSHSFEAVIISQQKTPDMNMHRRTNSPEEEEDENPENDQRSTTYTTDITRRKPVRKPASPIRNDQEEEDETFENDNSNNRGDKANVSSSWSSHTETESEEVEMEDTVGTYELAPKTIILPYENEDDIPVHVSPEEDGNIQDHRFQTIDRARTVNYVHRYEWMHPSAAYRIQNAYISSVIRQLQKMAKEPFNVNVRCKGCEDREASGDTEEPLFMCNDCDTLRQEAIQNKEEHGRQIKQELDKWQNTHPEFTPVESIGRCHWCAIKLPGEQEKRTSRLFRYARVDIPGVGPMPCLTGFDHEQNEICLHCAAELGALLKEKRRFQLHYELSAKAEPHGCSNCGIRVGSKFKPALDRTGVKCVPCYLYQRQHGIDADPPLINPINLKEFFNAVISNTYEHGIRWDKIANNPRVNPNFTYTAQGLHSQWLHSVKPEDAPALNTYILLQHNHRTQRTEDWELYTCLAKSPTQAALYFARFVSLYNKRPMTYLYIRQLETWNIPETRSDEWEDLTHGLLTFDQLKNRIRVDLLNKLKESPPTTTTTNKNDKKKRLKTLKDTLESRVPLLTNGQKTTSKNLKVNQKEWEIALETELGPENKHLAEQLPMDNLENARYKKYMAAWASIKGTLKRSPEWSQYTSKELDQRLEEYQRTELPKVLEKVEDVVGLVAGIADGIPLDPPEPRLCHDLPSWARARSRDIVRQSVADLKAWYAYERIELQKEMETLEASNKTKESTALREVMEEISLEETAAQRGFATRTDLEFEQLLLRTLREQSKITRALDEYIPKVQVDEDGYQELPLWVQPLRPHTFRTILRDRPVLGANGDKYQEKLLRMILKAETDPKDRKPFAAFSKKRASDMEDSENGRRPIYMERSALPGVYDLTPAPSIHYPLHLLPVEYQVHVFQSVLDAETRTASVRIVRTERYKLQGDMIQGGGPIQVPAVITQKDVQGFYRSSLREDYSGQTDANEVVVLRGAKEGGGGGGSNNNTNNTNGVEYWTPKRRQREQKGFRNTYQFHIRYGRTLDEAAIVQYANAMRQETEETAAQAPPSTTPTIRADSKRKRE
ncbi:hypothetical protein BG004_001931, partial [Podila humilis]